MALRCKNGSASKLTSIFEDGQRVISDQFDL